jgi:hypothetical protein
MALALLDQARVPLLDRVTSCRSMPVPYNPAEALAAYQNYFCGPVLMGVEVPPEAWGGHVYTLTEVRALADAVLTKKGGGMMMWELHKPGGGSENNPSAQMMATAICEKLGLGSCTDPSFASLRIGSAPARRRRIARRILAACGVRGFQPCGRPCGPSASMQVTGGVGLIGYDHLYFRRLTMG